MANLKQKLSSMADRGLNRADEVIDDARDAKQKLDRRAANADIGGRIEEFAENTGRTLRTAYEEGMDRFDQGTETARDVVQRNPLLAVAGAFFGGVVASMLLRK